MQGMEVCRSMHSDRAEKHEEPGWMLRAAQSKAALAGGWDSSVGGAR